jgi:hypothetical protein
MPLACVPILHRWEDDGRHWLLIRRSLTDPNEKAYYFVFAPQGTTLPEMVTAIDARWHIEEDFENAKDLGLDHYEVRCFIGWYRHITLVLVALAFLTGICATERCSTSPPAPSALPARPAVLALTVPEVRHLLARLIWPSSSSACQVLAWSCQLLPHETSSEGWLILASSSFSTRMGNPSSLLPDLRAMSGKSGSSGTFPGAVVRLVSSVVLL